MGSIGSWFTEKANALAEAVGVKKPDVASSVQGSIPSLPSGTDMGMTAEPSGYTSTGGRRLAKRKGKKTLKGGRRGRKTQRK